VTSLTAIDSIKYKVGYDGCHVSSGLGRAGVQTYSSLYPPVNVKKLNSLKQCLTATRPTSHN